MGVLPNDFEWLDNTDYLKIGHLPFRGFLFFSLLTEGKSPFKEKMIAAMRPLKRCSKKTLRGVLLDPSFLKASTADEHFQALYQYKNRPRNIERLTSHDNDLLNTVHRLISSHFNVHPEEIPYKDFFGGGAKLYSPFARGPFSWVLYPEACKSKGFAKRAGFEAPSNFPKTIKNWASALAALVPDYQVKDIAQVLRSLDLWLTYLIKLDLVDRVNLPTNFNEVKRNIHIARSDKHFTFMNFLDQTSMGAKAKDRALGVCLKMFALADSKYDLNLISLPINRTFDSYKSDRFRKFRTHREAIPLKLFKFIMEENRRDNFSFARSQTHRKNQTGLYSRRVFDNHTRSFKHLFFPAIPIALDLILNTGARSKDVLYLDSGEGDEFLVSADGKEEPNHLPQKQSGRKLGILTTFQANHWDNSSKILGLYFVDSKTGPYSIPYVEPQTARHIQLLRDWQIENFPLESPVHLASNVQRQSQNLAMFTKVFPLFRDPINGTRYMPPNVATLGEYWARLLSHCDQVYQEKTGQQSVFTRNGKPRWDVHSIRVTNITILLENGLPPDIVAMLVGHKSLLMTLHYRSPSIADINQTLVKNQKAIEDKLTEELCSTSSVFLDTDLFWASQQGEIDATDDGKTMLKQCLERGASPVIFSHGICPGANCQIGQTGTARSGQAVFRPGACSKCRFRLTGPAFLHGLVHRYNSLICEYKLSIEKEERLRKKMERAEDEGHPVQARKLRLNADNLEFLRDRLLEELALEYETIQKCIGVSKVDNNALISYDTDKLEAVHREVNDFTLLQHVIFTSKFLHDAEHEIPDGLIEKRTKILRKIVKANNLDDLFLKLTDTQHSEATEAFCNVLACSPDIDEIIEGRAKLNQTHDLQEALKRFDASQQESLVL